MHYNDQQPDPKKHNTNTYLLIVGIFLVVAGSIPLFWFFNIGYFSHEEKAPPYGGEDISLLLEGESVASKLYNEARVLRRDIHDYKSAIQKYEQVLQMTENHTQRGQILYEIGLAYEVSEREQTAISYFKQVATNSDISNLLRASAIEHLGQIYFARYDQDVFSEIFKGDLFSEFLVFGDPTASIRNMFEYGTSLYPSAYMELRLANWYAQDLLRADLSAFNNLSPADVRELIRQKVENADSDITSFKEAYNTGGRVSIYYLRKAELAGKLERLGINFLGDPEELFKKAFEESKVVGTNVTGAFALYNFAVYLAYNDPDSRAGEIKTLLSILLSGTYQDTVFSEFLKNAKQFPEERENVILLARIDSLFKETLIEKFDWDL